MSPDQLAICERVARVVTRTLSPRTHIPADDIRQEAWTAMLASLPAAQAHEKPDAVLYTAAMTACERFILRAACTVTAPRRKVAATIAESKPVDVSKATSLSDATPLADSALEARERTHALSLLLAEHLASGEEGHAVMAVLAGESKSSEAATEAGIEVARLYSLTKKAKRSIKADPRFLRFL